MAQSVGGQSEHPEVNQKHAQATAAGGAAATLTIAAITDEVHILGKLWFSWSSTPAAAVELKVEIGGVEIWAQDVKEGGVGPLDMGFLNTGVRNKSMVITLAGDGGTAVPKVTALYY